MSLRSSELLRLFGMGMTVRPFSSNVICAAEGKKTLDKLSTVLSVQRCVVCGYRCFSCDIDKSTELCGVMRDGGCLYA